MFCDIFKMIETRQLVNSIHNLPLALLTRLDKLNRFDAFYLVDDNNRLRERFLFLFKDTIVICRLKPPPSRTSAAAADTTFQQASSHSSRQQQQQVSSAIVSGSVSLANYFKGPLYFKAFIPVSWIERSRFLNKIRLLACGLVGKHWRKDEECILVFHNYLL